MSKIEEYNARAAESLIALEAATNERERMYHRRAYGIWRKLIAGIGEAEERAVLNPPRKAVPLKAGASKAG